MHLSSEVATHGTAESVSAMPDMSKVSARRIRFCPEWVLQRHFGAQLWRNIKCSVFW